MDPWYNLLWVWRPAKPITPWWTRSKRSSFAAHRPIGTSVLALHPIIGFHPRQERLDVLNLIPSRSHDDLYAFQVVDSAFQVNKSGKLDLRKRQELSFYLLLISHFATCQLSSSKIHQRTSDLIRIIFNHQPTSSTTNTTQLRITYLTRAPTRHHLP